MKKTKVVKSLWPDKEIKKAMDSRPKVVKAWAIKEHGRLTSVVAPSKKYLQAWWEKKIKEGNAEVIRVEIREVKNGK